MELTDEQLRAAMALTAASSRLKRKAAVILKQMFDADEMEMSVPEGAIAGIVNDFPEERLIVITWMGNQYPIFQDRWQTVSLDEVS